MKKFICLFLFSLLSSGLFARDFIIHDYYSDSHRTVYLTQVKNDDQYSVMVFENENYCPQYIISFKSQTKNYEAYKKAKDCFENIEAFIKEHNADIFTGRISNSNIDFGAFKVKIDNSRPLMYNDFQK